MRDRFHIIKGVSGAIDKYIIRTYPARLEIPLVSEEDDEIKHFLNVNNYTQRVKFAHEKKKQGMTVNEIAFILHSFPKTITKYLNPQFSAVNGHYNVRISNKLASYEEEVKILRIQGMTYPTIHKIISENDYMGSEASLRMFMQKERIRMSIQSMKSNMIR